MIVERILITSSFLVILVGHALLWKRRDNVLGYVAGGLFLAFFLIPLLFTDVLEVPREETVALYSRILVVGAAAYLVGLAFGGVIGNRKTRDGLTFSRSLGTGMVRRIVFVRGRLLAIVSAGSLVFGYAMLGYVPLTAADRMAAKYGVGPYAAGFDRGGQYFLFGLAMGTAALPIILALWYRQRRILDLALGLVLAVGLLASLSRTSAFTGLLLFFVAIAVQKRVSPLLILTMVTAFYLSGELTNEVFFRADDQTGGSMLRRVASGPPDVREHLLFLGRYELIGEQTRGRTILAGLVPGNRYWEPSRFTLRTVTGSPHVDSIPSGGLRLPGPLWGYVSFGFVGVLIWSFLAGLFAGWGTARLKHLLQPAREKSDYYLNLIIAAVFYSGTFGALSTFYMANSAMLVTFAIAMFVGFVLPAPPRMREGPAGKPEEFVPAVGQVRVHSGDAAAAFPKPQRNQAKREFRSQVRRAADRYRRRTERSS